MNDLKKNQNNSKENSENTISDINKQEVTAFVGVIFTFKAAKCVVYRRSRV